jgi:KaiC/GvpD/RAD55 family RecA-like ATPase
MLEVAKRYQMSGWPVFPVQGKIPTTTHGVLDASVKGRMAEIWWERFPGRGIGLATGKPSGVWVVDLDGDVGKASFEAIQAQHGELPKTVASRTGRGFHLFWKMPEDGDIRNSASQVAEKVDVRGSGGYVVLPPSPHPDGKTYAWLTGRSPDDIEIATAPTWLIELARQTKVETPSGERITMPDIIPEGGGPFGGRDEAMFRIGCSLRAKGLSEDAIFAALMVENRDRCMPPLDETTVRRKAGQAAKYLAGALLTAPAPRITIAPTVEVVGLDILEEISRDKQKPIDVVSTPWPMWNHVCLGAGGSEGLARMWHIVIGAASGSGKSLAAMNLAAHSIRGGHDTCLISLEMSLAENVTRLLAILTGDPVRPLEHGRSFSPEAWQHATEKLLEQPGKLTTNPGKISRLHEIEEIMRKQADLGVRLIVIDYLQLAWVTSADTLYQQITEVSHVIQGLAKELRVTTVGISQVNRRTSTGAEKMQKEGLMGGSSLENDAEQIVLIGRPEKQYDGYVLDVRLDKNRHGPQAAWKMRLDTTNLRMTELQ